MKKKILTIIGIILVLGLLLLSALVAPGDGELSNDPERIISNAESESKEASKKNQKEIINITVSKYLELSKEAKNNIFLLGKDGCPYCTVAIPILQRISKDYDLDIYYLNISTFTEEDTENFLNTNSSFQTVGTPFLFIVNEEEVLDYVNGLTDTAHYKKFFKENGFIE